jgi:hypothetical protein
MRPGFPVLAAAVAVLVALGATGCVDRIQDGAPTGTLSTATMPGAGPQGGRWPAPGLVDAAGEPFDVARPAPATGRVLSVTDFGADPVPGSDDDAAAIRAALAAARPGDEVVFPEGVYELRSTDPADATANLVLRSGVHLRGAGRDQTVLVSFLDGEPDSRVVRGAGVEDVVVADLAISSAYDGPLSVDTEAEDAGGGPMYGIHVGPAEGRPSLRVVVENVRVERFQRHGISVKSSREVTLTGNVLAEATAVGTGGQGYGIAVEGAATPRDPGLDSRHHVVTGNTFHGSHLRHAILLQFRTHNNLVADNTVIGSLLDAIDLHGEGEYLNEIRGNTVIGGQRAGIALGNSGGAQHQHDATGRGNWVHGNDLLGNREGVLVILGTPQTRIDGNRIWARSGSQVGVEVRNGPGTTVEDNHITGGSADFVGIHLREDDGADGRGAGVPADVTLRGNVIGHTDTAIRVDAGDAIRVEDNDIDGTNGSAVVVDRDAEVVAP